MFYRYIFVLSVAGLLQGCALKLVDSNQDMSRPCLECDPGLGYRVELTKPAVCNDYPVEYRRSLPEDDHKIRRGLRFRLFSKKPSSCQDNFVVEN